jgi:hypothetical protein
MTTPFDDLLARGRAQWGEKFNPIELVEHLRPYYGTGQRVQITTDYPAGDGYPAESWVRTGTIGATTGWRPAFLLMHRSSDHGSSDLLSEQCRVTAVQVGRRYVPVPPQR